MTRHDTGKSVASGTLHRTVASPGDRICWAARLPDVRWRQRR